MPRTNEVDDKQDFSLGAFLVLVASDVLKISYSLLEEQAHYFETSASPDSLRFLGDSLLIRRLGKRGGDASFIYMRDKISSPEL